MPKPTFYEFFAGGGMARAGLGTEWECLFANDFDPKKVAAYTENWGGKEIRWGDIHKLSTRELPGRPDLAWGSFPCQDLSLAGNGAGLNGERSEAFWGFWTIMHGLKTEGREPAILVLENVIGTLTSNGGKDFEQICRALQALGYVFGALTMDAAHFLPQSRPRLFIVAVRGDIRIPPSLTSDTPAAPWTSSALIRAQSALPRHIGKSWRWWIAPKPAASNLRFMDLIEHEPPDAPWHSPVETARFISLMSEANKAKLAAAQAQGKRTAGTIYRRTRLDEIGRKVQRAELRFDGTAGCLRTPGGGSSRQFVMIVEGASVRTRLLSSREAARLMGLPDDYVLPKKYNDAYHLLGDGLVVPVVRHLAQKLLMPLLTDNLQFAVAAE